MQDYEQEECPNDGDEGDNDEEGRQVSQNTSHSVALSVSNHDIPHTQGPTKDPNACHGWAKCVRQDKEPSSISQH